MLIVICCCLFASLVYLCTSNVNDCANCFDDKLATLCVLVHSTNSVPEDLFVTVNCSPKLCLKTALSCAMTNCSHHTLLVLLSRMGKLLTLRACYGFGL